MKAIKMPKELQPFLEFAEASEEETLVFTEKKRPVAALVSLRKVDRESLALSTNPEFLRIIETARKEIRAGKTTSLEELERKFRVATPNTYEAPGCQGQKTPLTKKSSPQRRHRSRG